MIPSGIVLLSIVITTAASSSINTIEYARQKFLFPLRRPQSRFDSEDYEEGAVSHDEPARTKYKYHMAHEKVRLTLLDILVNGTEVALHACQQEFKWNKWNCPEKQFYKRGSHKITREMGFISAIVGAGLYYSMTRRCAQGDLELCQCPNSPNGSWKECMRNLEGTLGTFIASMEGSQDAAALVDIHNHNLGQQIAKSTFKEQCKCHGITGSCSMKTCWEQLPSFSKIAAVLKKKYHRALRVRPRNRHLSQDEIRDHKNNIIFLVDSPDYCKPLAIPEWTGTEGRICSKGPHGDDVDSSEKRSCRELCRTCGHQVKRYTTKTIDRCNCNFIYCCEVKCDVCRKEQTVYRCDARPKVLRRRRTTAASTEQL